MVAPSQGDIWWAELPSPVGARPGFRRPVLVVQGDAINATDIATVICVPLTSNLRWASAHGNVLVRARATGLPKDSVANVSLVGPVARTELDEFVRAVPRAVLLSVLTGIDIVLGRA